jgi:hypothetical protein
MKLETPAATPHSALGYLNSPGNPHFSNRSICSNPSDKKSLHFAPKPKSFNELRFSNWATKKLVQVINSPASGAQEALMLSAVHFHQPLPTNNLRSPAAKLFSN